MSILHFLNTKTGKKQTRTCPQCGYVQTAKPEEEKMMTLCRECGGPVPAPAEPPK